MEFNTIALLVIAIMNLGAGLLTWRSHQMTVENKRDIHKIEEATNSMKDALVASTAKASYSEGHEAGRIEFTPSG